MSDKQVIDFLFQICESNLALNPKLAPHDFDSTNDLDSFLDVALQFSQKNI